MGAKDLAVWLDLQNNPLGTKAGENFRVPSNYQIPKARIYVVNHSRTRIWKRIAVPMSAKRGAEEVLVYDKKHEMELVDIYNVELLYRAAENGRDMNRYEETVKPVVYAFHVGQTYYAIPPAREKEPGQKEPALPRVEVKEGAWDLYLGNYDRMRAVDPKTGRPDMRVRQDEMEKLGVYWRGRKNPVFRYTDDGVSTNVEVDGKPNPYGYLEFIRETVKPSMEQIDKEYLTALDLIEA
jgi:hypothetical protein